MARNLGSSISGIRYTFISTISINLSVPNEILQSIGHFLISTSTSWAQKTPEFYKHFYRSFELNIYETKIYLCHVTWISYLSSSGAEHAAPGRFFITVNYFVHAIMYSYYASTSYGFRPSKYTFIIHYSLTHIGILVQNLKKKKKIKCFISKIITSILCTFA